MTCSNINFMLFCIYTGLMISFVPTHPAYANPISSSINAVSDTSSFWRTNSRRIICSKQKPLFYWDYSDVDFFISNINIGSECASTILQQYFNDPSNYGGKGGHKFVSNKSCTTTTNSDNYFCQHVLNEQSDKHVDASLKKLLTLKSVRVLPSSCRETDVLIFNIAIEQIFDLSDFNNDGILNIDEFSSDSNDDGEISYDEFVLDKKIDNLFKFSSLSQGCGAEDMDLNHIRKANPQVFLTFLMSTIISPHLALLIDQYNGGNIDKIIFGVDEVKAKSPFSWAAFFFIPGFTIARYFYRFFDTNVVQSLFLMIISIIPDVLYISEFLLLVKYHSSWKQQMYALLFFFLRNLIGFVFTSIYYLLVPVLINMDYYFSKIFDFDIFDGTPRNFILLFGFNYDLLLLIFMWFTYQYIRYSINFVNSISTRRTFMEAVNPSKMNELNELTRRLRSDLVTKDKVDNLYHVDRENILGMGGYGRVYPGHLKSDPRIKVAVKELVFTMKPEQPKEEVELTVLEQASSKEASEKEKLIDYLRKMMTGMYQGIKNNTQSNPSQATESFIDNIIDQSILKENKQLEKLRHEVLVLKVIKNYNAPNLWHPSLQEFFSAHINGNKYIIVSKRVRPLVKDGKLNTKIEIFNSANEESKLFSKLSVIQTFFSAIAALHEVGIVHRDIKPSNLCVSQNDNEVAVVIDFGISFIPRSVNENEIKSFGTDEYLCPEYFIDMGNSAKMRHGIIDSIAQGYKGPPLDVFASAITAIELLTNMAYTNEYIPKNLLEKSKLHLLVPNTCEFERVKRKGLMREMPLWSNKNIDEVLGYLPSYIPSEIKDLLRGMLHPARDKR